MIPTTDPDLKYAIVFIGLPVLMFALVAFVQAYMKFRRELDYINAEISRTSGREKKSWMKKRRRLWLSWLPFFKY